MDIPSAKEFGTACGSARGCGAQVMTTFGRALVLCSSMVMMSAKVWSGCRVAASMLNTGFPEYWMNWFRITSL